MIIFSLGHDRAFIVYPLREPTLMQFEEDDDDEEEEDGKKRKKSKTRASALSATDLKSAEVEYLKLTKSKAFGKHS